MYFLFYKAADNLVPNDIFGRASKWRSNVDISVKPPTTGCFTAKCNEPQVSNGRFAILN